MPYVEKLRAIKDDKKLTCAEIAKVGNIPLATVTRIFNEKTPTQNPTFETIVGIAIGMGVSLDELTGLKEPDASPIASPIESTINSYVELLNEKDKRIKELKNEKLTIIVILLVFVTFLLVLLSIDMLNGHFGHFQY